MSLLLHAVQTFANLWAPDGKVVAILKSLMSPSAINCFIKVVACLSILLSLLLSAPPLALSSLPSAASFRTAAQRALIALGQVEDQGFARLLSERTILIVKRRFSFGPTYKWHAVVREVPRSRRHSSVIRAIFLKYHDYYVFSRNRTGSGDIWIDENGFDHWGRKIGPSVEGKLASNSFWYIRFARENGKWRIRSLEECVH